MAERQQPEWGKKLSICCFIPQRVTVGFMGLMAIVNCYMTRVSLAHAITILAVQHNVTNKSTTSDTHHYHYCPREDESKMPSGIYEWSEILQGYILSSFFIGYIITLIPSVLLTDKFGGKWFLVVGMFFTGISSVVSPWAIEKKGSNALIGLRIIMGLGQGMAFPALNGIISSWVPPNERSIFGAFGIISRILGTVIGNFISAVLLDRYHWSILFYSYGASALLWCVFFIIFCFSYPSSHPCIKPKEKDFLKEELGDSGPNKDSNVPWMAIMSNGPVWALMFVQFGHDWIMAVIIYDLPKYFSQVLGVGIVDNGIYTSVPFIFFGITGIAFGYLGDFMVDKDYLTVTVVRKLMTAIASCGPALLMVWASYMACELPSVILLFTLGMGCMGAYYSGMKLSPMDLSPNNAAYIVAISGTVATVGGFFGPVTTGYIIPESYLVQWRLVFWLVLILVFFTALIFLLWGSSDVQPYNDPEYRRSLVEKTPAPTSHPFG